jgi:hypothetical protein
MIILRKYKNLVPVLGEFIYIENCYCDILSLTIGRISRTGDESLFHKFKNANIPILIKIVDIDSNKRINILNRELFFCCDEEKHYLSEHENFNEFKEDLELSLRYRNREDDEILMSCDAIEKMFGEYTPSMETYFPEFQKESSSRFIKYMINILENEKQNSDDDD